MKRAQRRKLKFNLRTGDIFGRLPPGELLLEQMNSERLRALRDRGQALRKYHSRQFFELEEQRAANKESITAALQSVTGITVSVNGWCRALKARYMMTPLSCLGSLKQSGRFHYGADIDDQQRFPAFPALYIAADRDTAFCEMVGHTQDWDARGLSAAALALQADTSISWLALAGEMHNVFDLTHPNNLLPFLKVTAKFKFSRELRMMERQLGFKPAIVASTREHLMTTFMDSSWRAFLTNADVPANGQAFGHLVSAAGFEGILYKSARTGGNAMAIFPRAFRNSSSIVRVVDPIDGARCVELSADNYGDVERTTW